MIIIIFTIVLLLVIIREIFRTSKESFKDLNLYTSRMLGAPKHIRLDKCNEIISMHLEPPQPKIGESRCDTNICPPYFSDFVTCYKCI